MPTPTPMPMPTPPAGDHRDHRLVRSASNQSTAADG
jgi:hypothetical protein